MNGAMMVHAAQPKHRMAKVWGANSNRSFVFFLFVRAQILDRAARTRTLNGTLKVGSRVGGLTGLGGDRGAKQWCNWVVAAGGSSYSGWDASSCDASGGGV